ncbi:hypothetical protein GQ53DRAFT_164377 [Thozetella sp. PMI_491]|nr:hypothetical protein GQ53DRAFT_164377 [Thozetella sp. PMI_491]
MAHGAKSGDTALCFFMLLAALASIPHQSGVRAWLPSQRVRSLRPRAHVTASTAPVMGHVTMETRKRKLPRRAWQPGLL